MATRLMNRLEQKINHLCLCELGILLNLIDSCKLEKAGDMTILQWEITFIRAPSSLLHQGAYTYYLIM